MRTTNGFLASALFCAAAPVLGGSPSAECGKRIAAAEWEPAAKACGEATAADPKNADAWFHLGLAQRNLKNHAEASAAFEKALGAGYDPTRGYAALAFAKALGGDTDGAFAALERSVYAGLPVSVLETHPGMTPLKADPRLPALRKKADLRAHPCEHEPRYRAFDFWVGEWDVFHGGQQVGTNRIERILSGCVLLENWTDGYGSSGKSMNYFDPGAGKWKQNWVDENGTVTWYEGEVVGGEMRYLGGNAKPDGTKTLARVRLAPQKDGTVLHVIEQSSDGGKSWGTPFELTYRRTNARKS